MKENKTTTTSTKRSKEGGREAELLQQVLNASSKVHGTPNTYVSLAMALAEMGHVKQLRRYLSVITFVIYNEHFTRVVIKIVATMLQIHCVPLSWRLWFKTPSRIEIFSFNSKAGFTETWRVREIFCKFENIWLEVRNSDVVTIIKLISYT